MATTSTLLADPDQVAAVRALITHARKVHAVHAVYCFGDGSRQRIGLWEHTWDLGDQRVALDDGVLIYRRDGRVILRVREVTDARQAGQLLAAIGVLPPSFATYSPTGPATDNRRAAPTSSTGPVGASTSPQAAGVPAVGDHQGAAGWDGPAAPAPRGCGQ